MQFTFPRAEENVESVESYLNTDLSGELWSIALTFGLSSWFPVRDLLAGSPASGIVLLILLCLALPRSFRKYLLFCTLVGHRRLGRAKQFYVHRQEEPIDYNLLASLIRGRVAIGALFAGGVICFVLNTYGLSDWSMVVLALSAAQPLLFVCLPISPVEGEVSFVVPNAQSFTVVSLAILLFTVWVPGPMNLAIPGLSVALVAGVLAAIAKVRVPLLCRRINLTDWLVTLDQRPGDKSYDWLCKQGHQVTKKFSVVEGELRNALELKEGTQTISLPPNTKNFQTGLLCERTGFSPATGTVRLHIDDSLVLERPIASLSPGWNSLIDLIPASPAIGLSSIRAEITDLDARSRVFLECPQISRSDDPKAIIVLMVDALRKDSVGIYGASDVSTPYIDTFFSTNGAVYDDAWVQGEWTTTNFGHMFTSRYSSHHKANHRFDGRKHSLPEDRPTLAESFQNAGWRTFLFSASQRVSQSTGYDRGFSRLKLVSYKDVMSWDPVYSCIDELERSPDQNHLIFLHIMDAHGPPNFWSHKRDIHSQFAKVPIKRLFRKGNPFEFDRLYKNQVEELDLSMSVLLAYLNQPKWRERTALVLVADHGQPQLPSSGDPVAKKDPILGERMLNVPLMVSCPWRSDLKGKRFRGLVEAGIDLQPSLLELAGISAEVPTYARSFLPTAGKSFLGKKFAVTESIYEGSVQQVIRTSDSSYYRRFNWRGGNSSEEEVWRKDGKGYEGPERQDKILFFRQILKDLKLVSEENDPEDYYGK